MSQTETQLDPDTVEGPETEAPVKKHKSRRPANTAFRQQRLKAWQPILTPKTVLPLFFVVGIIFAPIGGLLLWASSQVQELVIDYSDCNTTAKADSFSDISVDKYTAFFKTQSTSASPGGYPAPKWRRDLVDQDFSWGVTIPSSPQCTLELTIPNDMGQPVLLYYRLTNFYQNHRRYVKSFNVDQLNGKAPDKAAVDTSPCDPLKLDASGKPYYPCGLIANSMFNDTFSSPVRIGGNSNSTYAMSQNNIAWSSDQDLYKKTTYTPDQVVPPRDWRARFPNGYTTANMPDLSKMQDLQVWMRTAGLPTFSKLAARNDDAPMTAGTYQIHIFDNFPVTVYGGTKSLVLTTRTVMGGRNSFLGIAYVVVGGLLIVLGVLFALANLIRPRKLGDHNYLTWNQEKSGASRVAGAMGGEGATATTTGLSRT